MNTNSPIGLGLIPAPSTRLGLAIHVGIAIPLFLNRPEMERNFAAPPHSPDKLTK
jgi:hypothetical protein